MPEVSKGGQHSSRCLGAAERPGKAVQPHHGEKRAEGPDSHGHYNAQGGGLSQTQRTAPLARRPVAARHIGQASSVPSRNRTHHS